MSKSAYSLITQFLIKRRLSVVFIVFFGISLLCFLLLYQAGITLGACTFESITFLVLHLLFALILHRIHKFYHSKSAISIVHLGTLFVFTIMYVLIVSQYANLVYPESTTYVIFVSNSLIPRGIFSFVILLTVAQQFWMDKHLESEEKRQHYLVEQETKRLEAELNALNVQFQPHFLFNSLNSISALVGTQPKEARRMILLLSDFLRLSIRNRIENYTPIHSELAFLNLYVEIEKVRFGHRLHVQFDIDEDIHSQYIPSQIIQPLVENALKYGLYGSIGSITIQICIQKTTHGIQILIKNPFDENAVNTSKGAGFGISSIAQKLKLLYGRTDLIKISTTNQEFEVQLLIPFNSTKT